jgi:hypothetical protein
VDAEEIAGPELGGCLPWTQAAPAGHDITPMPPTKSSPVVPHIPRAATDLLSCLQYSAAAEVGRGRYRDTHPSVRQSGEFDLGGRESQTRGGIAGEKSIDRTGTVGRGWTARASEEEKMGIGPGIGCSWFF